VVSIDGSSEDSVAAAIEAINRIAANRVRPDNPADLADLADLTGSAD